MADVPIIRYNWLITHRSIEISVTGTGEFKLQILDRYKYYPRGLMKIRQGHGYNYTFATANINNTRERWKFFRADLKNICHRYGHIYILCMSELNIIRGRSLSVTGTDRTKYCGSDDSEPLDSICLYVVLPLLAVSVSSFFPFEL